VFVAVPLSPCFSHPKKIKTQIFFVTMSLSILYNVTSSIQNLKFTIVVVDPLQVKANLANNKKRKKIFKLNLHFQISWATKLPWEKSIMGVDKKVMQVKFKVCSVIKRRKQVFGTKVGFFVEICWPKEGLNFASTCAIVGDFYYFKTNEHVFNEKFYMQRGKILFDSRLLKGLW